MTIVPTEDTVTNDTVPDATTFNEVAVTDTTLLTDTVPVAMFDTETTPVTTAVTVPVATTMRPVAVAVRPELAVVNASWETETVPVRTETVPDTSAEPVKETTVVAPPPGAIQTGNPVMPDKPLPVVVGTMPDSAVMLTDTPGTTETT